MIATNRDATCGLFVTVLKYAESIKNYSDLLHHLPLTFGVIDFVGTLFIAARLDTDIIEALRSLCSNFISNCICRLSKIYSYTDTDNHNRSVQLVCMLTMALVKDRDFLHEPVRLELEMFCVQFARLRECSSLFQYLKNV